MKNLRIAIAIILAGLFAAPALAQSAGDKGTGSGGTNGQQSSSTNTSSGASGSGQGH